MEEIEDKRPILLEDLYLLLNKSSGKYFLYNSSLNIRLLFTRAATNKLKRVLGIKDEDIIMCESIEEVDAKCNELMRFV